MIATLTFKIHGSAKAVRQRSQLWMRTMGKIMGRTIDGITLVELGCDHSRKSLAKLKHEQINALFPKSKP